MQRAENDDYWIYHVLQKGVVKKSGTIDAAGLARLFKPVFPEENKSWVQEISGRILSIAIDIKDFADQKAAPGAPAMRFRHLLDAAVLEIRKIEYCDVWLTPEEEDPAHSDFAYHGPSVKGEIDSHTIPHDILLGIAKSLTAVLMVSDANDLSRTEALRPARP
jgi:hypothetical protein